MVAKKSFVEGLEAVTRRCSIEKGFAKDFVKLTIKHRVGVSFILKLQTETCNFIKKESLSQFFSLWILKNFFRAPVQHLSSCRSSETWLTLPNIRNLMRPCYASMIELSSQKLFIKNVKQCLISRVDKDSRYAKLNLISWIVLKFDIKFLMLLWLFLLWLLFYMVNLSVNFFPFTCENGWSVIKTKIQFSKIRRKKSMPYINGSFFWKKYVSHFQ